MFQFHTKAAGVTFDGRQRYIRHMRVGEPLRLVRDKYNPYDRNAIQIINASGEQIGFIAKDLASDMAPRMDSGVHYTAVCTAITGNPGDNFGVNLLITQHD